MNNIKPRLDNEYIALGSLKDELQSVFMDTNSDDYEECMTSAKIIYDIMYDIKVTERNISHLESFEPEER